MLTNTGSAVPSNPPAYERIDTKDSDGKFAKDMGEKAKRYCQSPEGTIDHHKLRRIMRMLIAYVEDATGVELPSVATAATASDPTCNNPRNPDEWNWSTWEAHYIPKNGTREMVCTTRQLICRTFGGSIGKDEDKILSLLAHPLFKGTVSSDIDRISVKNVIRSANECSSIFDSLFRVYECRQCFSPVGMIKAAISLGYMSREDIQYLYAMGT